MFAKWLWGLPVFTCFFEGDAGGGGGQTGGGQAGGQGSNSAKMVPESDLLAVKAGAEKDLSALKAQLETLQKQFDSKHQESSAERAKREDTEKQLVELQGQVKELEELRSKLAASEVSREGAAKQLLDLQRKRLVESYGLKLEDVQNLTQDQVTLADTLLSKVKPRGSYDRGGASGDANFQNLSSRDKIRAALNQR